MFQRESEHILPSDASTNSVPIPPLLNDNAASATRKQSLPPPTTWPGYRGYMRQSRRLCRGGVRRVVKTGLHDTGSRRGATASVPTAVIPAQPLLVSPVLPSIQCAAAKGAHHRGAIALREMLLQNRSPPAATRPACAQRPRVPCTRHHPDTIQHQP